MSATHFSLLEQVKLLLEGGHRRIQVIVDFKKSIETHNFQRMVDVIGRAEQFDVLLNAATAIIGDGMI